MRVVVTGGAGFIGSNIVDALVAKNHEVLVIDDLSRGHRKNLPSGVHLLEANMADPKAQAEIVKFRPDALHHHAAQIDVRRSVSDPMYDANLNITGTIGVAKAAADGGAQVFIFASSGGAIYGEQDIFPAPETHPVRPDSPYGLSKYCGELYLDYFRRKQNLRSVFLRYANVYGPRQDPHGEAGVVAIFAERMLANQAPVIYGDGLQTRDFVYVKDVVQANIRALENESAAGPYNIGTGVETNVLELAAAIRHSTGFKGDIRHEAAKAGEQKRSVLDASHARNKLGWKPDYDLATGIEETVAWFRARAGKNSP